MPYQIKNQYRIDKNKNSILNQEIEYLYRTCYFCGRGYPKTILDILLNIKEGGVLRCFNKVKCARVVENKNKFAEAQKKKIKPPTIEEQYEEFLVNPKKYAIRPKPVNKSLKRLRQKAKAVKLTKKWKKKKIEQRYLEEGNIHILYEYRSHLTSKMMNRKNSIFRNGKRYYKCIFCKEPAVVSYYTRWWNGVKAREKVCITHSKLPKYNRWKKTIMKRSPDYEKYIKTIDK